MPLAVHIMTESTENGFTVPFSLVVCRQMVGGRRQKFVVQSRIDCIETFSSKLRAVIRE